MAGASDVLAIAKSQLGLSGATRYGGNEGDAWCSYFLYWCAQQAGVPRTVIPKRPWCDDLRGFYLDQERYFPRKGYTPKAGDIICFDWAMTGTHINHVGFVSAVDETYVYTIEGNSGTDGRVHTWRYPLYSYFILGYCSPLYEAERVKPQEVGITTSTVTTVEDRPTVTRTRLDGSVVQTKPASDRLTIAITAEGRTFAPRVLAGASLSLTRHGAPGTLVFEVLPGGESFFEGSRVYAMVGETVVFCGYVFTKSRDEDGIIKVTAYDQLRYFKNKDLYIYSDKSASDLLRIFCRDYGLAQGEIEESGVKLPYRVEDNNTLFDIIGYALDYTEKMSGVRCTVFDDAGKLCLAREWASGCVLDAGNVSGFAYTSSVDGMINRVKHIAENGTVREITLLQDSDAIGRYGVLQSLQKDGDLAEARALLRTYDKKQRRLQVTARGDIRVRAGSTVGVRLTIGDLILDDVLTVAFVRHSWDGTDHTMELTLEGGEFDA